MKCPYCGAQIANDSLTCPNCGREVQMTFDEPEDDWAQPGGSADQRTGTARADAYGTSSAADTAAYTADAQPSGSRADAAAGGSIGASASRASSERKPKEQRKADKKTKKAAKAEVKRTKSAYKNARKAAGKSVMPRVVAFIAALLLAAATGAYGMWSYSVSNGIPFTDQQPAQAGGEAADGSGSESASDASADSASSSESASSPSLADDDADAYKGTWRGDMTQTKNESIGNDYRCYGASANPLEMTITQVDASGRIKADVKVLLHNHRTDDLSSDFDSVDGDQVVELKNLTGTLKNGTFKFTPDISDYMDDGDMTISVSVDSDDGSKLDVLVGLDGVEDDEYVLSKDAGDSDQG